MQKPTNISSIFYTNDGTYLIGYPKRQTVQSLISNLQDFYEQKNKPSITIFKLFPKTQLKSARLGGGNIMDNINIIAQQFQYEQDYQPSFNSQSKKKPTMNKTSSTSSQSNQQILKKHPLYRLYAPSNPVLRQQYSVFTHQSYKRINNKQQQQILKQRIKQWIEIGYHIHIAQAFKFQYSQGRFLIFMQKLKGRTLRDWINQGFFIDKNKYLNSKRILNCLLQILIGLNYIHKHNIIHQEVIPDYMFVENQKVLKIGNLAGVNLVIGKMAKNFSIGGSPQYWSPEQGIVFDKIYTDVKEGNGNYATTMKLLPSLNYQSDIYQVGLIVLELMFSERMWDRGDKVDIMQLKQSNFNASNANKQTTSFLFQKLQEILKPKAQQRMKISQFIISLLQFYAKNFKNAQDLLWCRFFNEQKYQSDLLNNKAVGLYLSGNDIDCQKSWIKSIQSNQQNLIAQYNYSHFKRMKRIIDDKRLNKDLFMLPQSRKRNFYLLISNLVMLPLLKQPFKTFNFNPKLSKNKQIQTLSNILDGLQKFKKPKQYSYLKKYQLRGFKFDEAYVIRDYFIARAKGMNNFYGYKIDRDIRAHTYIEIKVPKQATNIDGRQAYSVVDGTNTYLAISDNSYLCILRITQLQKSQVYFQITDYGSSITTMQFDQKSEVLGVGSNQFTVKLINLTSKNIYKVINIGQKFIIKNLQYYDRNTCICYSYQKSISCHRIETTKQLFTIKSSSLIINYKILQPSLTSHLLIIQTTQKFQIWNLKDKVLIRNIQIDQAPMIQNFYAIGSKKLVVHYTKNIIRIWNYMNGLILKTFRVYTPYLWVNVDNQGKYVRSLDNQGNFVIKNIDFSQFLKHFQGVCIPNEISMTDQREENNQQTTLYVKYGRQLIQNLNQYRLNQQQKKVSLQKMYKLAQTIKSSIFYQDKQDLKVIFTYLNSIKQSQDKSSRINAHSQQYIFMSHKDEFITATSNLVDGYWLIGGSDGSIRLVSAPDNVHLTIKPKNMAISFLYLQQTSFFVGYMNGLCYLLQRDSLNIVVTHGGYHKHSIRMGLILSSILTTGDQQQLILFWSKQKIRRYRIPVNIGQIVGKKLIIGGFDNRIRLFDIHQQNGLQKLHVFIGHVQGINKIDVIDDGIFVSGSYDGSVRWWSTQAKNCFSYYNFKKYFPNDKILFIDMPKFSLQQQKHGKIDHREGSALILLNGNQIVIFDTMRKQIKWKIQMKEEVIKVNWTNYPNQFMVVIGEEVTVINVYWRYMVIGKK